MRAGIFDDVPAKRNNSEIQENRMCIGFPVLYLQFFYPEYVLIYFFYKFAFRQKICIAMQEKMLIEDIRNGSEKAFKILYSQWVSRLYQFVYQYLKSESATDDVVQEIFMRIWTNRESLNSEYLFKSYLFTIAYHCLLKELKRQINNPSMEKYLEYQNTMATKDDEISDEIDYDTFQKALEKAKSHLSHPDKGKSSN